MRADSVTCPRRGREQDLPKDDPFKPGSTRPHIDPIRKGTKPKPYKEIIIGKRGIGQTHAAYGKVLCVRCQRRFCVCVS